MIFDIFCNYCVISCRNLHGNVGIWAEILLRIATEILSRVNPWMPPLIPSYISTAIRSLKSNTVPSKIILRFLPQYSFLLIYLEIFFPGGMSEIKFIPGNFQDWIPEIFQRNVRGSLLDSYQDFSTFYCRISSGSYPDVASRVFIAEILPKLSRTFSAVYISGFLG